MITKNIGSFPAQKLPMSKKTKAWKEACVDYIIEHSYANKLSSGRTRNEEMLIYYDLYNSIYNEKDLKYVTNPYKQDDGFPATALDYNIIKPKVDLLLGEETKRPFNFRIVRTSDNAISEVLEQTKAMIENYILATVMGNMGEEEAQRHQQALLSGEVLPPEAIADIMTKSHKDIAELTAQRSLDYLLLKLNVSHEFYKGWKDALIAGEEIYYVGVLNGNVYVERVNPMFFNYDTDSSDLEMIHDSSWCSRKMIMSATDAWDRFSDKMTEKQLTQMLELLDDGRSSFNPEVRKSAMDYTHMKTKVVNGMTKNPFDGVDNLNVWHACWKSFKKIGFVTILDPETEQPEVFEVDETYKPTGLELDVEWVWIVEVWEGYRIGEDLYFGIQPLEYQYMSSSDLNSQRLPYTGVIYNNTNSVPRSLVSMMKPLQYMYIILWYRLELAISRDKGKVPLIDITQIPVSMGIDVNKWMHYLSALGVAFVNPYEEGWDIPGREGGKPSQFNQFAALDLSMANTINQYIELMSKIENMLSEITGITPLRQGAIATRELVGNVERSVVQSAHITEPLFWMHNLVKKAVLTMMLNTAKHVWKNSDRKFLLYILDDGSRVFLNLEEKGLYEDMDLFVDDSSKQDRQLQELKTLIQPAIQNGASLLDAAEIITLDNVNMLKNKLAEIEQTRMQREQAAQEQEQQMLMQMAQMQQEAQEETLILEEAKLDLEKYKIDQDNQTRIIVAQLLAYRGASELDADNNGIPDPIEIANQALNERKLEAEMGERALDRELKEREMRTKAQTENKKMEHEMKLQKLKDEAALERERIKSRTALKNKVVGEK